MFQLFTALSQVHKTAGIGIRINLAVGDCVCADAKDQKENHSGLGKFLLQLLLPDKAEKPGTGRGGRQ